MIRLLLAALWLGTATAQAAGMLVVAMTAGDIPITNAVMDWNTLLDVSRGGAAKFPQ